MENCVTIEDIHVVLEAQRRGRPIPQTPLHYLILNEAPSQTSFSAIRNVELIDWLIHQIVNQLNYHRNHFSLRPICMTSSLQESVSELSLDFKQNATELEAWSLLYFYYVRVDLSLHWETMETITAQSQRNLRRRREHGLNRLLYMIIREKMLSA